MSDTLIFTPDAQPWACWVFGGLVSLFGLGFAHAGYKAVDYAPAQGLGQMAFAAVLLFFAWRAARYHRRPVVEITPTALHLRPFWWFPRKVLFAHVQRFGLYAQINHVREYSLLTHGRRTGSVVVSQHLVCTLISGAQKTLTLPGWNNDRLLKGLKRMSGKPIEMLPEREAGLRWTDRRARDHAARQGASDPREGPSPSDTARKDP